MQYKYRYIKKALIDKVTDIENGSISIYNVKENIR